MKILVVQIGRIGDMVLTTPLLRALRLHYPDAELHVLASRTNAAIVQCSSVVSKVWVYDKSPFKIVPLLLALRRQQYDVWIDSKDEYSRNGSMLARYARAAVRIGFNSKESQVFTKNIAPILEGSTEQVAARHLAVLQLLNIQNNTLQPQLCLLPNSVDYAEEYLRQYSVASTATPLVMVNISAGNDTRRWGKAKWTALISVLLARQYNVLLSFTPDDSTEAEEIQKSVPTLLLYRTRSIHDVIAMMSKVTLLISPDTSLVHIAAAFNTPVVGLYPALEWNTRKFRPLSTLHHIVLSDNEINIHSIDSEKVVEAVDEVSAEIVGREKDTSQANPDMRTHRTL